MSSSDRPTSGPDSNGWNEKSGVKKKQGIVIYEHWTSIKPEDETQIVETSVQTVQEGVSQTIYNLGKRTFLDDGTDLYKTEVQDPLKRRQVPLWKKVV